MTHAGVFGRVEPHLCADILGRHHRFLTDAQRTPRQTMSCARKIPQTQIEAKAIKMPFLPQGNQLLGS